MIGFSSKRPITIFLKIFIPFMASVIIIIIVTTTTLYTSFRSIALEMVYKNDEGNLKSVSLSVSNLKQILSSISLQCYFNDTIREMMYYEPQPENYSDYISCLYSYKSIFPYLDSIYVYNGKNFFVCPAFTFLYDKNSFPDKDIVNILDDMKKYPSNTIIPRMVTNSFYTNSDQKAFVYSYLFYDSQQASGSIGQAIVLNVKEDWLKKSINTFNGNKSRIIIVDSTGRSMINDTKHPALTDISKQKYISDIIHSKNDSGRFTSIADGEKSFITYTSSNVMDWRFISITPYSNVELEINTILKTTLLIGFGILFAGSLLILYYSRKLFVPVHSMIADMDKLYNEKRKSYLKDKNNVLAAFVLSGTGISPEQKKEFEFKIDETKPFTLLIAKIDFYRSFCISYNKNDRSIMTYGISNIIEEILSKYYNCESANLEDDSTLVILNEKDGVLRDNDRITELLSEIQSHILNHLELSLTFTIGNSWCDISKLHEEYETIQKSSEYRMTKGHGSVINLSEVNFASETEYIYPYDKEKVLIETMMLGQSENAKDYFREIIASVSNFGRSILSDCLLRLLLAISNAIVVIQKNNAFIIPFDFNECLDDIREMETTHEIIEAFFSIFDAVAGELEKNKDTKYEKIIEQVTDIVNKNYVTSDLSLENIADMVKFSPYYLSKLFKKHKLIALNDYINNVRLNNARELILKTDQSINNIMGLTGFISRSHFYTLFKKAYGVSPNQLRKDSIYPKE